jgi:hypothetical protein
MLYFLPVPQAGIQDMEKPVAADCWAGDAVQQKHETQRQGLLAEGSSVEKDIDAWLVAVQHVAESPVLRGGIGKVGTSCRDTGSGASAGSDSGSAGAMDFEDWYAFLSRLSELVTGSTQAAELFPAAAVQAIYGEATWFKTEFNDRLPPPGDRLDKNQSMKALARMAAAPLCVFRDQFPPKAELAAWLSQDLQDLATGLWTATRCTGSGEDSSAADDADSGIAAEAVSIANLLPQAGQLPAAFQPAAATTTNQEQEQEQEQEQS